MFAKIIEHFTDSMGYYVAGFVLIAIVVVLCANGGTVQTAFSDLLNTVFTKGSALLPG